MRAFRRLANLALAFWLIALGLNAWLSTSLQLRLTVGDANRHIESLGSNHYGCRIIVVGSSPGIYGLSAAGLAEKTRCAPFNVSLLNVSQHFDIYLEHILKLTQPGDVVVITDRRWTLTLDDDRQCPQWICMLSALKLVPYLYDHVRTIVPDKTRDSTGDIIRHPPMVAPRRWVNTGVLGSAEARLDELKRQYASVTARGGCPVFVSPPMLVEPASLAILNRAVKNRGQQISTQFPDLLWVPPLLSSDISLFTLDGQHASASMRSHLTTDVGQLIRSRCPTVSQKPI